MRFEHMGGYNDYAFQVTPPFFQPLRRWRRPQPPLHGEVRKVAAKSAGKMPLHAFTIKGGFVNTAGGQRRLIMAGTIFKHKEC